MGEVQTVVVVRTSAGFQMSAAAEWEADSSFVAGHRLGEEDSAAALQPVNICSCSTTRREVPWLGGGATRWSVKALKWF